MGGDSLSVPILYEANATDFNNLGLGPLVDTTVATVTEERNGQFILEMQYPVDGIRASLIAKNRILKVDAGHKLKDQRFVIKRINRIMGNDGLSYSIYAEHISYITADYALKPNLTVSGSGNVAMTQWLNGIIDSNRIHVDSDITTENTTSWTIDKVQNARQALGGVQGSILDVWGGEYRFDNLNISLLRHRGTVSNTLLSYGRNITDFDQEENITNTYTSIYPFASYSVQNGDTSEQKILTIPNLVVDSEYVNNFPNRKIQVVDFSDKFSTDEKPTVERLAELAKSYIKNNNVGVPTVSTKISFVDLSKTENYKEFAPLEELDLCDEVPFAFEKFGIKTTAKISRIVWNVLLDSYDSLELGELKTNLSDVINNTNNAALDAKDAANDAKNNADNAALSANGKNRNWYGADDPAFGHLSELREGDSWYMPNGEDTELYHWINGQWVFILSTKDTHEAKDAADTAQKEAEEAKKQANMAVDGANDAVAKAGFANDTATQAKSDAATAGQQAKDALTSAGTALTDAQKALTNSSSAMADSTQARKDSATAKIQAANAANQANQAVTDASTAKADAAAAKGQATSALGQANTAINNAANALDKFNNLQIGGRNLALGTAKPFTMTGNGSHKMYATSKTISKGTTVTVAYDITSTKSEGTYTSQFIGGSWRGSPVSPLTAGTQHISYTMVTDADYSNIQMAVSSSTATVTVSNLIISESSKEVPWTPAPEDVQQQFTDVNGELSQKVSQTTYNVLAGTVDTVSTLAKQNQSTISTLATKNSVDTVNHTATAAQTLAQQNATELLNKANSTTVNTLTQRVTTAESTLSQTATKAELALTKTDVDKLGDSVASQALDIAATADGLKLKADSSTVSDIDGRVTSLSGQLDVQADKIAATVTANDVAGMLNGYATQTWTQSQIKMTADGINGTMSSVKSTVDGHTTSINDLKADSSSFKGQFTTVNDTIGKHTTDIGTLQSTSKELTTGFNTLTTDNTTNKNDISQLKQTATELNSTMMTVQTQVQNSAVGTNLLKNTRNLSSTSSTVSWAVLFDSSQVYDSGIKSLSGVSAMNFSFNVYVPLNAIAGSTVPIQLKGQNSQANNVGTDSFNTLLGSSNYVIKQSDLGKTIRVSCPIQKDDKYQSFDTALADTASITIRQQSGVPGFVYSKIKLEKGSLATDWCPNPADNASVTALSKLSQTVDGMQSDISKKIEQKDLNGYATQTWTQSQIKSTADSINLSVSKVQTDLSGTKTQFAELEVKVNGIQTTVSDKADQSQVTQLAGQITSVVGDVSANSSQITQMKADINLRVKAGDVVNQINISPEGILIAGEKVHITGQTTIDNAVIKDAMIADIKADKITAGTLNAANVNVINLNANNITTGTIKGANLSMNLNTGEVVFQNGRIHSTSNNVDVNINQGYLSVANGNTRVLLKNGGIQFVQPTIFDEMTNPYLSISNGGSGLAFSGARIVGRDYVVMANNANSSNIFDSPLGGAESFAGISAGYDGTSWHPTKIGGADRGIILSAGKKLSSALSWVGGSASIRIGSDGSHGWNSNRIELVGEYVHSLPTYVRTASGSANVIVAQDGALVRSTSASKYKTDIIRTNVPDYGDKLLNLPTATWMDIAETKRYRDDPVNQIKPTRNFGMIAEDLADAGLEMLVVRGLDGKLEGINYDRIGPALIPVIAKLKNEVETLKQQLEAETA